MSVPHLTTFRLHVALAVACAATGTTRGLVVALLVVTVLAVRHEVRAGASGSGCFRPRAKGAAVSAALDERTAT